MGQQQFTFIYRKEFIPMFLYEPRDVISSIIESDRAFFELPFLERVEEKYKDQKVIVDVGANIGNHTLFFAKYLTYSHIYAFEPQQGNALLCAMNVRPHNDAVTVYPVGLSNVKQIHELHTGNPMNSGGFTIQPKRKDIISPFVGHFYTLDSFRIPDVSLLKVDVEGHEIEVLKGAQETIATYRPVIMLENLHHMSPTEYPRHQHRKFFHSIDYTLEEENMGGCFMDAWVPR